ncbi:MAG TPA: serine hydrolase domain-containing protein [Vicinamibacterales bacterium]|nr:serine hydrolase domain-containing protein [Vicinamibacterales bacterium]
MRCVPLVAAVLAAQVPGDRIDALMVRAMQERHVPGLAIAVVDNGVITEHRSHGIANLETATPMTTGAVFELASVTKPITATAVMMLVEEGRVSLDAPISTYIDDHRRPDQPRQPQRSPPSSAREIDRRHRASRVHAAARFDAIADRR